MAIPKGSIAVFTILAMALGLGVTAAKADWVARYNGPADSVDAATAIMTDDSGNIFVTGISHSEINDGDFVTLKYNSAGTLLWQSRYDGPAHGFDYGANLVPGEHGTLYAIGSSVGDLTDLLTIKYAPTGDTLWTRRYNSPVGLGDIPVATAIDSADHIYVTAYTFSPATSWDFLTVKYSPIGDTLWTRRYNGSANGFDQPAAIAVDLNGDIVVTGRSPELNSNSGIATVKYSPSGSTLWERRYSSPVFGFAGPADLAIDAQGSIFVTGHTAGNQSNPDYTTIKYTATGDTAWVRHYNGPANYWDFAEAIILDETGNVYVTGRSTSIGVIGDFATVKYDPNGNELWVQHYSGPGNGDDRALAIAIDTGGCIIVAGYSEGTTTGDDYTAICYSQAGELLWLRRYNGPASSDDQASALHVAATGQVVLTGSSFGFGTREDFATVSYSTLVGDVNCDGGVDLVDLVLLGNALDGLIGLSGTCSVGQADANLDGTLDEHDYNLLYDLIAGVAP